MIVESKSTSASTHSRFEVLDGMRGVAAIAIMIFHFSQHQGDHFMANANLAVDIFFMLSGFVIIHSYGKRLHQGMTLFDYAGKRFIRLYPMFLIGIIIGIPSLYYMQRVGAANGTPHTIFLSVLCNLFYLPSFNEFAVQELGATSITNREIFPTNPPAWSLFFEVVASFAFLFIYRLKRPALVGLVGCSLAAYVAYGVFCEYLNHRYDFRSSLGWNSDTLLGGFPRVLYGFSVGVLIYSLAADKRLDSTRSVVAKYIKAPILVYFLLTLIFIFENQHRGLYQLLILCLVAPILIYAGSIVRCPNTWSLHSAQFLGWISYPLYCVHFPIGRLVFAFANHAHYSMNTARLVSIAASLGVACVLTKFFDEPARRYLSARLSVVRKPVTLPVAAETGI